MQKQTFINQMKTRGHELRTVRNGDITIRWVTLANHGVHIDTPTVTALTDENATDAETMRIVDAPTA